MNSLVDELVKAVLFAVLAVPALFASGLLALAGMLALHSRQDLGNVWLCLPAGVLLAVLACFLGCHVVWIRPRRTIWAFKLEGSTFAFQTVTGWHTHSSSGITRITPLRRRRGRLAGWEFDVPEYGLTILPIAVPNSQRLIAALSTPANKAGSEPAAITLSEPSTDYPKRKSFYGKDRGLSFG